MKPYNAESVLSPETKNDIYESHLFQTTKYKNLVEKKVQ